jgi:ABC transporter
VSGPLIPPGQRPGLTPPGVRTDELDEDEPALGDEADGTAGRRDAHSISEAAMAALPSIADRRALPKLADPDAPLLVVDGLKTYFSLESGSVKAVDGVSFRLDYGEALGIAGESGCGKTTTALSLVRILPPNATIVEGSIKLMGIDLVRSSGFATRSPSRSSSAWASRRRPPGSGPTSSWSWSASRPSVAAPTHTNCRAGCASGR